MPSTVLAVDDSVTLRKVLEITFAGPEFRIVTANSADAALQKLKSDKPDVVIADVSLEPKNGYDLCKAIKQASPSTPVLILSSKHNPFDQGKASAAQADDHIDKPFDTQMMIDKVKKLLGGATDAKPEPAKPVAATPAPAAVQPKAAAPAATPAPAQAVARSPAAPPAAAGAAGAGTPGSPLQRAKTLIYTAGTPAPGTPAAAAPAAAAQGPAVKTVSTATAGTAPARQPAAAAAAPAAAVAAASLAGNGQLTSRLEGLGLTPAQVDAVAAISRDVVERIVWEVVPVLAESLIKEEIARLTK